MRAIVYAHENWDIELSDSLRKPPLMLKLPKYLPGQLFDAMKRATEYNVLKNWHETRLDLGGTNLNDYSELSDDPR
jgi:hypothetical protein